MGLSDKAEWFASPIFIIMQAAPLAALIPLIVFAYGIGLTAKTLVVCIMAMPVIVLNSFAAVRHTPASLVEMGRSFLGDRRQIIQKVILPAASPVIFAGSGSAALRALSARSCRSCLLPRPASVTSSPTTDPSRTTPACMRPILSIIVFSVLFIEALERIEVTLFRPEKRARS
jgi:NitT/TauT family transport system permease protein